MNILVLNGSPKRAQSDTMHITRAFLEGMNEVQKNEIEIIDTIDCKINYCLGCLTCKKNGGVCVQSDDMDDVLKKIRNCDLLLLSFPLYNYSMPANLKVLFDRTMPLSSLAMQKKGDRYSHPSNYDLSKLKYVMICGCGFPNSKNNFEGILTQLSLMFAKNRSTVVTVPESPMFNAPEADEVTKPFLSVVKQAGNEYAQTGKISQQTADKLTVPMIPEDVYAQICNDSFQGSSDGQA